MSAKYPDPFSAALAELLGPLAQVMVARGLTIGAATEAMKRALLDAVITEHGTGVSDSRISVLTGLHRKDVRRLRSGESENPTRKTVNRSALLISYWATTPDYQGADGQPRNLTREATPDGPGFNDLVQRTRLDVAPGTVLQTLVDQGAVIEIEPGQFKLLVDALVPAAGSEEMVTAYRATLSAHLSAATQNLLAHDGAPRHFDRVLRYSHLSDASIAELDLLARQGSQQLLQDINARARELQELDAEKDATGRFAAGAYVLQKPAGNGPSKK